jgi:hypothetical protein
MSKNLFFEYLILNSQFMKQTVCILVLAFTMLASAFAQAPQTFSFQAVVRDRDGNLVSEKDVTVTLAILRGSPSGAKVYEETFSARKTDRAGVLSLSAGMGTPVSGKFSDIKWNEGVFYVKTSLRLPGDAQTYDMGTIQLLSVPYALYAETSGNSGGGSSGGDGYWQPESGGQTIYTNKMVNIKNQKGNSLVEISPQAGSQDAGYVGVNANNSVKAAISSLDQSGAILLYDRNGEPQILLKADPDDGFVAVTDRYGTEADIYSRGVAGFDERGYCSFLLYTTDAGGQLEVFGQNETPNVFIGCTNEDTNAGGVFTRNRNDGDLVRISHLIDYPFNGGVEIYGAAGPKGTFYVAPNGKSQLWVDEIYNNDGTRLYSSTADYSLRTRSDGGADPCYVTETGDNQLIVRGTATLRNGSYTVTLPAEAASKILEQTLTVQLTPRSAASKGLAIVDSQAGSFTVAELMSGDGSYAFDWTLTALRRDDPELRNGRLEMSVAGPSKTETKAPAPRMLRQALPEGKE